MGERWIARAVRRLMAVDPSVAVIVFGLALALYLQGAYYGWAQLVVAVVLFAGVLLLPRGPVFGREDLPVALAVGGFAGWAVVDGLVKHEPAAGVRYALLIAGLLVFAGCCRELRGGARTDLVRGLIVICGLVAALGWVGVVIHHPTWGYAGPGLWRASSTLTYPNATAALLAVAGLVCLAIRARDSGGRWLGIAATALITGLAATLSRAGLLAFGVGAVVLVVGLGWRPVVRAALAPLVGSAVAMAGLLPSITADTPTVATVGLAVAAALAGVGIGSLAGTSRLVVLAPVAGVGVVAIAVVSVGSRFSFDSPDRWDSIRAAWRLFTENPLTGAGPGLTRLTIERTQGGAGIYRYVHNEYVQVLTELGVIGGVLLVVFLFTVVRRLHRPQPSAYALGFGVLAGVVALVVHAGFDFVWHIPAVPLVVAALIGLALPEPQADQDEDATDAPQKETERSNT
jgi:O-antigen ligase